MLVSGIGLEHALRTLGETALDEGARRMCREALVRLGEGASLSEALNDRKVLPHEALMSISAGETAGELPMVFIMLAEYFELKDEVRRKISSSLVYPFVVMGILLCVMMYMGLEVLPRIAVLLPATTTASPLSGSLVSAGLFLKSWGILILGLILVGAAALIALARAYPHALMIVLARIPVLGQVNKERELALGFFALYVLQKSGVSLDIALNESAAVAGGLTAGHIKDCSSYLMGGLALSEAVRRDVYFPSFTADTLRVGEESGRFIEYFERLFHVYNRMFRSRMDHLAGSLRPVLLIVSAGFIALIAIGFLQPLYGNLTGIGVQ